MQRSKFDTPAPDECPQCQGTGHDQAGRPEVRQDQETKRHYTTAQGSGCPRCQGVGRLNHD